MLLILENCFLIGVDVCNFTYIIAKYSYIQIYESSLRRFVIYIDTNTIITGFGNSQHET